MGMNTRRLVLVAEDDAVLRYLAKRQLTSLGYDCEIVNDGNAAVEKVKEGKYDLIILDLQMPVMNGLEAAQAIRKYETDSKRNSTPILAMTANPRKEQCFDAGMNDFIFKPVALDELKTVLLRWLMGNEQSSLSA